MKKRISILIALIALLSCKDPIPDPVAAVLQFPEDNLSCLYVTIDAANANVIFQWILAEHTDSYLLEVENSETGQTYRQSTEGNQITLNLQRGYPYQWKVTSTSEASAVATDSETRRFYLERQQQANHIPFPATLTAPAANEGIVLTNGRYNFSWVGIDLDNDISHYTLRLGNQNDSLETVAENISASSYEQSLENGTTYFWQIITHDAAGNTSQSQIGQFQTTN